MEDVVLQIIGDIDLYEKELAKLTPITNKEAKKAADALAKQSEKGQRAAVKAGEKANRALIALAKKQAREFEKSEKKKVRAAKKAAADTAKAWDRGFALVGTAAVAASVAVVGAAIASADALFTATQEVANLRNAFGDLGVQTGIQAETLAGLNFALGTSGKELGNVEAALRGLPKRLADFKRGTGEAKFALEELGFETKDADGLLADMDGTVKEIFARLNKLPSAADKSAAATAIFGEQGAILNQVLAGRELTDWIDNAEKFGADVGPEAIKTAREWQTAMAILGQLTDKTKAEFVDFFDVLGLIKDINAAFVFWRTFIPAAFNASTKAAVLFGNVMLAVATRDLGGFVVASAKAAKASAGLAVSLGLAFARAQVARLAFIAEANAINEATDETETFTGVLEENADANEAAAKAAEDAAKAAAKAQAAATKAFLADIAAMSKATDQLSDIRVDAERAVASEIENINAELQDQLNLIAELEAASGDAAAAEAARAAVRADAQKQINDARGEEHQNRLTEPDEIAESVAASAASILGSISQQKAAELDRITATGQAERAAQDERRATLAEVNKELLGDITEVRRAQLEAQKNQLKGDIDSNREILKGKREGARKAFKATRAAALGEAAINTALAITQSLTLGPIAGPIAAAAVAAASAVQVAAIAGQKPPQFAIGGITGAGVAQFPEFTRTPEQLTKITEPGEATLTPRATRNVGPDAIRQANATGDAPMAQIELIQVLDGRIVARMTRDQVRQQGPGALGLRGGAIGRQNIFGPL